jgi:hypothetical protein
MTCHPLKVFTFVSVGSLLLVCSAGAQTRNKTTTVQSVQQNYGIQGAYDGTFLHPAHSASTAVPVTMEDGRTGEIVVPNNKNDPHPVYYRDDETGGFHPVTMDPHATRQQVVASPHAVKYQPETQHPNKTAWEDDALVVGGSAAGGAVIGASIGGKQGAAAGAVAGGVGGLIYDLLAPKKK